MNAKTNPDDLLSRVTVASPCHASWDEMHGGDRVRSCDHCRKKVYNLSEMTAGEAAALVREAEGAGRSVCVRFYRRADGTMLTRDCPVGLARVRQRVARAVAAVFGSALVTGGAVTHLLDRRAAPGAPDQERPVPAVAPHVEPLMGAVAPPPPRVEMGETSVPSAEMGDMAVREALVFQCRVAEKPEPEMGKVIALPMAPAGPKTVPEELEEIRAAR